ncbi:MAG: CHASE2 domain-containing protein [Synechococcus sp.]|nr:CHASE2 domain-containing protein [Synechococcus sp.]
MVVVRVLRLLRSLPAAAGRLSPPRLSPIQLSSLRLPGKGVPVRRLRPVAVLRLLLPCGAAALLLLALERSGVAEALDLLLYDLITTVRPAPSARNLPIMILGFDEADLARYRFPIDDRIFCAAIDRLLQGGALAVGLDVYRDRGVGPDQQCLRDRFRQDPRLVTIFNQAEGIGAIPGTPAQRRSFNDIVVDPDGVVRRDLVHVSGQDEATVALPLRLLEVGFRAHGLRRQLEAGTAPGPWLEPGSGGYDQLDAAGYQEMLPFRRPRSFASWSLRDLFTPGRIPAAEIRGRIILIGSTAPSLRDLFEVPQSRFTHSTQAQPQIAGVEIHALRLASLIDRLHGDDRLRIRTPAPWTEKSIELLAVALGIGLGEAFVGLRRSVLVVTGLAAGLVITVVGLLYGQRLWLDLTQPLAGLSLMASAAWLRRGVTSQQQRQQFEKLLGQTTSPAVARQLWNQRESLLSDGRFEGRLLPVTVLFSDLSNFTTVSESLSPRDLLAWLNRAMAICVPAITHRGGMVNKFTGDGFLAVFGAPVSAGVEADASGAIEAALEIQTRLTELNAILAAEGLPTMRMRLGIHSGDVLAGSMGSSERVEYALIGDTVNCASRLESLEKERHTNTCRILVSAHTYRLLPGRAALEWQSWGPMRVKGREEPLDTYELRGRQGQGADPAALPAA